MGSDYKKRKEEDRSNELEEKPQFPLMFHSGATADRAAKHDLQDEIPRGIAKRFSFISDEPPEIMKKYANSTDDFKNLTVV